ncbi:COPB2, partial [Symbiodinium microadriaticum]
EDRVFLIDKAYNVISHKVLLSVLNYQTAVVRQDFETANSILPTIPRTEYTAVARFLESQGFKNEALTVSTDLEHRFELAIDLRNLSVAHAVMLEYDSAMREQDQDSTDYQNKWKRLGDLALSQGSVALAQTCTERSCDLSGQLLLYAATGNRDGVLNLAHIARSSGRSNVAFLAFFVTGRIENCIQLLYYKYSVLELWKMDLRTINEKAADALADPEKYPNLFPDLQWALKVEDMFKSARNNFVSASSYLTSKEDINLKLIEIVKMQSLLQSSQSVVPEETVETATATAKNSAGIAQHGDDIVVNDDSNVETHDEQLGDADVVSEGHLSEEDELGADEEDIEKSMVAGSPSEAVEEDAADDEVDITDEVVNGGGTADSDSEDIEEEEDW